jgi:hypothetical protein
MPVVLTVAASLTPAASLFKFRNMKHTVFFFTVAVISRNTILQSVVFCFIISDIPRSVDQFRVIGFASVSEPMRGLGRPDACPTDARQQTITSAYR